MAGLVLAVVVDLNQLLRLILTGQMAVNSMDELRLGLRDPFQLFKVTLNLLKP